MSNTGPHSEYALTELNKPSSLANGQAKETSSKEKNKRTSTRVSVEAVTVEDAVRSEPLIVDWDGPDDPENPKNWPRSKKMVATCLASAMTFLTPLSSSMIAPAGNTIAEEFGISNPTIIAMTTSIFVLAYAFGPLILGPLSEIFGRSRAGTGANIIYLAFNLACGFSQNTGQLIAFRFLSGLGGSAPFSISGGILGDIWDAEERGTANGLYTVGAVLGTAIGGVVGAWIAERASWRWVFWSTSAVDFAVVALFFYFVEESYAPTLLARRAAKIRNERGIPKGDMRTVRSKFEFPEQSYTKFFSKAIARPFVLFAKEPIIQAIAAYMAFVYGIVYLVITIVPDVFITLRGESLGISGLHYIAHGLGAVCAAYFSAMTIDPVYRHLKARADGVGQPEFRLPNMILGTIFLPIGMFILGWTSAPKNPWIAPDIGLFFIAAGTDLNFQPMTTYIIDAFTLNAASALAAATFFRSIAGFAFPLFAPAMYKALGYGPGSSMLAAISIVLGCPIPFILWHFGPRLRAQSRFSPTGEA